MEDEINEDYGEEEKSTTTIFAVRTTISREKSVLEKMFNRLLVMKPFPDIKAIIMAEQLRGYVFVEARFKRDVMLAISGLRHVKGKILGSIKLESIVDLIKPRAVQEILELGDIVEVVSGVFEGRRAEVLRMPKEGAKQEVTLRLLDSDTAISIKIHGDYLKLIEKGERRKEQYVIKDMESTEEGVETPADSLNYELGDGLEEQPGGLVGASLQNSPRDDIFTFEDELDSEYVEDLIDFDEDDEEEAEDEEEDEWSKFEF